jgi:hypothetical protein
LLSFDFKNEKWKDDQINNNDQIEKKEDLNLYNSIIDSIKDNYLKQSHTITPSNNKTIKDIYDELTNDNRLALQQNLDELEANDFRNDYIIGEKYGSTRFDTYHVK